MHALIVKNGFMSVDVLFEVGHAAVTDLDCVSCKKLM